MLKQKDLYICLDCYCDFDLAETGALKMIETVFGRFGARTPIEVEQNVLSDNILMILEGFGMVVTTEISIDRVAVLPLGRIIVEADECDCLFCYLESCPKPFLEEKDLD